MRLRRSRIWIGAAIFLVAGLAGFAWVQPYAPEHLRTDLEARLSEKLRAEVRIPELRLSIGWGLRLVGRDVELRPRGASRALRAERVTADLRPFANLTGQRLLRLLRVEGPRLELARRRDGSWAPLPPGAADAPGASEPEHPDELLRPLVELEALARRFLSGDLVADTVELRHGHLILSDAVPGQPARSIAFSAIQGLLRRSWRGDTRLRLRARLQDAAGEHGSFEIAARERRGVVEMSLGLTDLDLAAVAPWLREPGIERQLGGRVAGALSFEAPEPGRGRLGIDLVGHHLLSTVPDGNPQEAAERRRRRGELSGALAIEPESVRIAAAHFATDTHSVDLDGSLERPLRPQSRAEVALAVREADFADLRHAIAWLPEVRREEAESLLSPLERGRMTLLRIGGAASLSGWQAVLAGRTRGLPQGFVVDARLEETTLRVGPSDRLEGLSGRLWWTGDRLEIRNATAELRGNPLPELDLTLDGVANLLATDPAARRRTPGAPALRGLQPLWRSLTGGGKQGSARLSPVALEVERLDHPIFFWPLRRVSADVEPVPGGVRIELSQGALAGAPLTGEVDWLFEPTPRVQARLRAGKPTASEPAADTEASGPWLRARFEMGAVEATHWSHAHATGRLEAEGPLLRVREAEVALAPSGRLGGELELDLSQADAVPFALDFDLEGGDVATVGALIGLPHELATGTLAATGSLAGRLEPGTPTSHGLSGSLSLDARDGTIAKAVPAVVAVALASEVMNPFANRDHVRYERVKTQLELDDGTLHTEELTLEGPDVRAVASGGIDLADEGHPLDVEVVLFLFRPVDAVLEMIPLVNFILLGENENLVAAHFSLQGPWEAPESHLVPHRSFTSGPGSLVFERLPSLMRRGIRALDSLFSRSPSAADLETAAPAAPAS